MRLHELRSIGWLVVVGSTLTASCGDATGPGHGALGITVAATGHDIDRRIGLMVDAVAVHEIALDSAVVSDSLIIPGLRSGPHTVEITDLEANCAVGGQNPRSVSVVSGDTATTTFALDCEQRMGSVRVTTLTSGSEIDEDGYSVIVDGAPVGTVGANDVFTISGVPEGIRAVRLAGQNPNCVVAPPHPRQVHVPFQGTGDAVFAIHCTGTGAIQVTVSTAGTDPDRSGYEIRIDGSAFDTTVTIGSDQTVTVSRLPAEEYSVLLTGVAVNCTVGGGNPRTVAVAIGATAETAFEVECGEAPIIAFVRGSQINVINVAAGGAAEPLTAPPGSQYDPAWSPDGELLAFTSTRDGDGEIYVMQRDGSSWTRLTTASGADHSPSWSPDGTRIAFVSQGDGNSELYVMSADGSNLVRLTNFHGFDGEPSWSPDGTRIAFQRDGRILVMSADGSQPVELTQGTTDSHPAWSPDGHTIAFSRGDCYYDYNDIMLIKPDGSGLTRLSSGPACDTEPAWSPDGNRIAYTDWYWDYGVCYYGCYSLRIMTKEGNEVVDLVGDGYSPAWRP